jgi:predicted  nucleic acid-binding Zn-ribbon protein
MDQKPDIREQLNVLMKIQSIDIQIDMLHQRISVLPKKLQDLHQRITKITVQQKKVLLDVEDKTGKIKQLRSALEVNQQRLDRSEARLLGVTNSTEYQAVLKEIDQMKKMQLSLTQQVTELEDASQLAQKELDTYNTELDALNQTLIQEKKELAEQEAGLKKTTDAFISQKNNLAINLPKLLISQYNRVRSAREGIGIVPLVSGQCKGCHMMIPPQIYNEIQQAEQTHMCPNCRRFLMLEI